MLSATTAAGVVPREVTLTLASIKFSLSLSCGPNGTVCRESLRYLLHPSCTALPFSTRQCEEPRNLSASLAPPAIESMSRLLRAALVLFGAPALFCYSLQRFTAFAPKTGELVALYLLAVVCLCVAMPLELRTDRAALLASSAPHQLLHPSSAARWRRAKSGGRYGRGLDPQGRWLASGQPRHVG